MEVSIPVSFRRKRDMVSKDQESHREINHSAMHMLHRASQCAGDLFTEEVDSDALTPRQFAVLLTISQEEGLSQTDLVDRTGIDRSTLADIIRRMQKKGLIRRRRTKTDARVYAVKMTDEGAAALRSAQPAVFEADARLLAALPKTRREEFLASLSEIVGAMTSTNGKGGV
jgi:DNA-binding MarR family transcriptional regulator